MNKDILLCGVGGQGTVLASNLIAAAAMSSGDIVHSAETIGMAQRGGSVTSHVRIGTHAYSPLIPSGKADLILAFEPAEAARNLIYLKKDGMIIVNKMPVKPVTESLKDTGYDGTELINYMKEHCPHLITLDGESFVHNYGSAKYLNVALLGVATGSGRLGLSAEAILKEIEHRVPEKFRETNIQVFNAGREIGEAYAIN